MRRAEVIAKLKAAEPAIRARGAAALYLFGSHARDQAGADIDVFIDKDRSRKFGFDEFMDIYFLLRDQLGANVDYGTRVPSPLKQAHPEVRWEKIHGLGNLLRHEYRRIDLEILWSIVTDHLSTLDAAAAALLDRINSDSS